MKALAKFKRVAIAACAVAAGLFAHAATEKTSYYAWDETKQMVLPAAEKAEAVVLNGADISSDVELVLDDGWYVTKNHILIDGKNVRVEEGADVKLILADDATMTITNGSLIVNAGSSLTIYGQEKNSGQLIVAVCDYGIDDDDALAAAIGGEAKKSNGPITIHGGTIRACSDWGAGIGSGGAYDIPDCPADADYPVCIYGGSVDADSYSAAGIGGGSRVENKSSEDVKDCGRGCDVYAYGGIVRARAHWNGAGIGGGASAGYLKTFCATGACVYVSGAWENGLHFWEKAIGGGFWGPEERDGYIKIDRNCNYN